MQSPTTRRARFEGDDCSSLGLEAQSSSRRRSGTMPSRKTAKLVVQELLQFAALVVPLFVIMERFARIVHDSKGLTSYWLVVAVSIAYVTTLTLLVWAPLKYLILKRRGGSISEITQW